MREDEGGGEVEEPAEREGEGGCGCGDGGVVQRIREGWVRKKEWRELWRGYSKIGMEEL